MIESVSALETETVMRQVLTRDAISPLDVRKAIEITCSTTRQDSVERVEPIESSSLIAFVFVPYTLVSSSASHCRNCDANFHTFQRRAQRFEDLLLSSISDDTKVWISGLSYLFFCEVFDTPNSGLVRSVTISA